MTHTHYFMRSATVSVLGILFAVVFFSVGIQTAEAAPIKILNNSNHAYGTIGNTVNLLLGTPYTSSQFTIDFTTAASWSCSTSPIILVDTILALPLGLIHIPSHTATRPVLRQLPRSHTKYSPPPIQETQATQ
ncbi:MAG: hypothetical protein ACYC75_03380 [Minisyncoccota bacterium]